MPVRFGFKFGFPFGFRARPSNRVAVTNTGTVDTPLLIELIGPLTDPEVVLSHAVSEDVQLMFDGTIVAGDTLHVNTADRTVLLNGASNRRDLLVTASSRWFNLPPGNSTVILTAQSSGAGAGMRLTFRSAYQ